jgi:hypothetical protein
LLSFVLTPLLLLLRKIKVPRVLAVAIVVTFAFAIIFALGWMLSQQASQLAGELPRYQHVLAQKIAALRKSAESSSTFEKAARGAAGRCRHRNPVRHPYPAPAGGSARPAGLVDRSAKPHRVGHPRHADAFRPQCGAPPPSRVLLAALSTRVGRRCFLFPASE